MRDGRAWPETNARRSGSSWRTESPHRARSRPSGWRRSQRKVRRQERDHRLAARAGLSVRARLLAGAHPSQRRQADLSDPPPRKLTESRVNLINTPRRRAAASRRPSRRQLPSSRRCLRQAMPMARRSKSCWPRPRATDRFTTCSRPKCAPWLARPRHRPARPATSRSARPREFAAVTLHATELRLGLDLGDRPFDPLLQKAKLQGPRPRHHPHGRSHRRPPGERRIARRCSRQPARA